MKDHETRELVNTLRDLALQFHDHQSLRERIAHVVVPVCAKLAAQQAQIDQLMLEHCPSEMTAEQLANWKKHQVPHVEEP